MHRITLQHRSRLLRINPRRYFIASGVSLLIMYSKFTIPPLVEIRPVITQRVTFRFRAIRPTFPTCIIYGDPFRVIPGLFFSLNWAAQLLQQQRPQPRRKFRVSALYSLPQLSQFLFIIAIYQPFVNPLNATW